MKPVDWSTQCEALIRGTKQRCPHRCRFQIPNILAGHFVMDKEYFEVYGRPVHLCYGHWRHWHARQKRLLTVALIDGGYLSAYNHHAYGSIVTAHERIDFKQPSSQVPKEWGVDEWKGNVPDLVRKALKITA